MKKMLIAALVFLALGGSAQAQYGIRGQVELSPFFGALFPDNYGTENPDTAPLVGLRLGYFFTNSLSAEISAQRAFAEAGNGLSNIDIDSYRLNLLWNINTKARLRPFLTGGFGYERFAAATTTSEPEYNAGAGVRFFAGDHAGLRLDGRVIFTDMLNDWQISQEADLGLFFLFGKKSQPKKEEPAPKPVVKDSDNDGVNDDMDQCPGTPTGSKVDAKGCIVANDDDKDGVTNEDDKCPATPENAPVDETGCPTDMDGDNVKDYMDRCPNTPAGTQVDEMGCPMQSKARGVLSGVTFVSGKAELTENANTILNGVAEELKQFPEVKVEIQGHTDNTGSDEINLNLSQKRAESVMAYLTMQGIPAAQLTARGYGESAPIADNKTPAGREKNRRVEMKWID